MIFSRAYDARCDDYFRIFVTQSLFTVDFHRFVIIFPCGPTAENPVNSSFNHTSSLLKGAQLLKVSVVPVLDGF